MQNFEWSLSTKIFFGIGEFSKTGKRVKGMGKRALIITSQSYSKKNTTSQGSRSEVLFDLLSQLNAVGIESEVFSEIEPNPHTTTIDRAAAVAREFKPRFVIALGGGSVMDASKCIAMLAINPGKCADYVHWGSGRERTKFNDALPLVCIPTIAATSSETDSYAVVTDPVNFRKAVVWGDKMQPAVSIIDPELTFSVPARQTVDGAFDIITHVIEEYLSAPHTSPDKVTTLPDNLALAVIESVVDALPKVLSNPKDSAARSTLSWAASFALCGALRGRDGSFCIHSIEHGLSACTDLAHGRGLAMILPRKMAFDSTITAERIIHFGKRIFGISGITDPIRSLNAGLVPFMKEVGAWTNLNEIPLGFNPKVTNHAQLIDHTIEHSLEVDAILKRGEEPYLENVIPLRAQEIRAILNACKLDKELQ